MAISHFSTRKLEIWVTSDPGTSKSKTKNGITEYDISIRNETIAAAATPVEGKAYENQVWAWFQAFAQNVYA